MLFFFFFTQDWPITSLKLKGNLNYYNFFNLHAWQEVFSFENLTRLFQRISFELNEHPKTSVDPRLFFATSPYGTVARKRSAQDGVQGAPVNKRKSLLMKPRHYSPSEACEEESEDLARPQDKEELRNIDTPAGKQMSCCFVCFDEQLTLNFKIPSVAFIFPLPLPLASSRSHCAVEVKDYTAGPILVVSHVHKLKFWQLICHDIFGFTLFWWGQISDTLICPFFFFFF